MLLTRALESYTEFRIWNTVSGTGPDPNLAGWVPQGLIVRWESWQEGKKYVGVNPYFGPIIYYFCLGNIYHIDML